MTSHSSMRKWKLGRPLEIGVGLLSLFFAVALTVFVGLAIYRTAREIIIRQVFPGASTVLITLAFAVAALVLWLWAIRLLRGVGARRGQSLMSPAAYRAAALFFLAWSVFVVWAGVEVGATWEFLLAPPGLVLMVLALRRAGKVEQRQ